MATLIPSIGTCVSRMTSGERRLAERLEQKLDDDYLLWYDVPVGPKYSHPDFVVMHPRRGLLVLEVKDWRLGTIQRADKQNWEIIPDGIPKNVINPLEQARQYAHQVVDALQRDKQLVQEDGKYKGKLAFPWSYGVVFSNITRKQFNDAELGNAIEPHRVICQDEMLDSVGAEELQSRLWDMFPYMMGGIMSLPQLDRVRWIMFPEVRVQTSGDLFNDSDEGAELPDIMRVMDLQQEQLARSLGDGHRVIHGVAGSGKTMILGYRAEYLAKAHTPTSKPILVLCYNEPLAVKLESVMEAKGLTGKVHVRHFHRWCRQQLVAFGQTLPPQGNKDQYSAELVERVIRAVDRKQIPSGQYQAVLIDEGHDFAPEWLKLVTQMVDPATSSLLLLYDDAQSIYERSRSKQFSFKSVGVQAQGRTTILKINYRNSKQILQTANLIAADLLTADEKDDDGIPLLKPISCGREPQDIFDYLFGMSYLAPRYSLTFDQQEISQLSPGERGLLLLVFYLLVDKEDIPIIIDQPEENLDNQTIFKVLVKCIKAAKQRRQVIMVTHNPNLAVVCDAEQIICATCDKATNTFHYISGGIESPAIKAKVVEILEGTEPAFRNRKRKYGL